MLALLLLGTACTAWRQVEVAPTALSTEPKEVRLTHLDGTRLVLSDPRIVNDTLYGTINEGRYGIALADVQRIAVPSASNSERAAGTTFVGVAVAAFLLSWVIFVVEN
jgi:hypothetical protein